MILIAILILTTTIARAQNDQIFKGEIFDVANEGITTVFADDDTITVDGYYFMSTHFYPNRDIGVAYAAKKTKITTDDYYVILYNKKGNVIREFHGEIGFTMHSFPDHVAVSQNDGITIIDLIDLTETKIEKKYKQVLFQDCFVIGAKIIPVPLNKKEVVELPVLQNIKQQWRLIDQKIDSVTLLYRQGKIDKSEGLEIREKARLEKQSLRDKRDAIKQKRKEIIKEHYQPALALTFYNLKGKKIKQETYEIDPSYSLEQLLITRGVNLSSEIVAVDVRTNDYDTTYFTAYGERESNRISIYDTNIRSNYKVGDMIFGSLIKGDTRVYKQLGSENATITYQKDDGIGIRNNFVKDEKIYLFGSDNYLIYDMNTQIKEIKSLDGKKVSLSKKVIFN